MPQLRLWQRPADMTANKFVWLLSANHRCVLQPVDQWQCSIYVALNEPGIVAWIVMEEAKLQFRHIWCNTWDTHGQNLLYLLYVLCIYWLLVNTHGRNIYFYIENTNKHMHSAIIDIDILVSGIQLTKLYTSHSLITNAEIFISHDYQSYLYS